MDTEKAEFLNHRPKIKQSELNTHSYTQRALEKVYIQSLAGKEDNYGIANILSALYVMVFAFDWENKSLISIWEYGKLIHISDHISEPLALTSSLAEVMDKMLGHLELKNQPREVPEEEAGESEIIVSIFPKEENSNYPAALVMEILPNWQLCWKYDRQIYSEVYMDTLTNFFVQFLEELRADNKRTILEFRNRYNRFMVEHSSYMFGKKHPLPNKPIMELIYERIRESPDKIAVIDENEEITYSELGKRINGVANFLLKKQVRPKDMIALIVNNSIHTLVCIAGIFKVGAGYIPVDYTYPEERQKHIIQSAKAKFTLGRDERYLEGLIYYSADFKDWDTSGGEIYQNESSPGYVMFTSGTTGQPKGVAIRQRQLLNLLLWYCDEFKIDQGSRPISLHSFAFDTSFKNIFGALIQGGTAVIHLDNEYDFRKICQYIGRTRCTHVQSVTSLFDALLTAAKDNGYQDLKTVISANIGGEKFFGKYIPEFYLHQGKKFRIANVYGTTEATDYSVTHYLTEDEIMARNGIIPAGVPLYNQNVFVCSKNGFLCGKGVPGEIYLGGLGVAEGYVDQEERNSRVFKKDLFQAGDHIYLTGDQGYWNYKGELVVLDRLDNQVKLNGYRIELAEIEKVIERYPGVDKCKVIVDSKNLLAFYTLEEDGKPSVESLIQAVKKSLPRFMLPLKWYELEQFPLSHNGKIDNKALNSLVQDKRKESEATFLSETENKLSKIWCKILDLKKVSIKDNYFDLGGNSLTLFRLSKEIEDSFKVKIKPIDFMELATIEQISAFLGAKLLEAKSVDAKSDEQSREERIVNQQKALYAMRDRREQQQKGAR